MIRHVPETQRPIPARPADGRQIVEAERAIDVLETTPAAAGVPYHGNAPPVAPVNAGFYVNVGHVNDLAESGGVRMLYVSIVRLD